MVNKIKEFNDLIKRFEENWYSKFEFKDYKIYSIEVFDGNFECVFDIYHDFSLDELVISIKKSNDSVLIPMEILTFAYKNLFGVEI